MEFTKWIGRRRIKSLILIKTQIKTDKIEKRERERVATNENQMRGRPVIQVLSVTL